MHPIEDTETSLSSPGQIPVPPPAPESPILFSNAENIPLACCANHPAPRALLQPIEEAVSDAEDSNMVAERLEDQIGDEITLHFLTGSNQGQGACHRAVHGLAYHSAPYPHRMQPGEHPRPRSFKLEGERLQQRRNRDYDLGRGVISVPPRSPTPAARTVSFLMDHQLEPVIRTLQAAWLSDQEPLFWSMQGSISADSFGCYRLELAVELTKEEGD